MNTYASSTGAVQETRAGSLYARVATLLTFSSVATAAGAYLGRDISGRGNIFVIIAFFATYIGLFFLRNRETINVIALYAFTFVAGLMIGPVIGQYLSTAGGSQILVEAFVLSGAIFAGAAGFGWLTSVNLEGMRRFLFGGLLLLIGFGLVGFFFIHSAGVSIAYNLGIVVVFVGFTALDFQRLKSRYGPNDYIMATVAIYLDFLNIFLAVLSLLGGSRRD